MTVLLLLAFAAPLLIALMALSRALRPWLLYALPWAAVPALLLALLADETLILSMPYGLTGVLLGLDALRRVFLVLAALLWLVSGAYAVRFMASDGRGHWFALFWLLTLTGNIGLILSFDVLTFYSFFALMTFAGYGLVIHSGAGEALRAGRVYLIMAVLGEGLLMAGLLAAVAAAGGHPALSELPQAIGASGHGVAISTLIFLGFGVKAGVALLHFWLPLAHPVAPTPASAVLSGSMIKAGLLGWLVVLPLGEMNAPVMGAAVLMLGLVASLGGALVGVCQQAPKVVLAYSSISQMGLITMILGVALVEADLAPLLMSIAALYGLHHGLAKGALFLGVSARGSHWLFMALAALPALSLAGLPLTSGAAAKLALKDALPQAVSGLPGAQFLPLALGLGAVATTLLMVRFLWLLWRKPPTGPAKKSLVFWWLVVIFCGALLFWWLPLPGDIALQTGMRAGELPGLLYPLGAGAAIALVVAAGRFSAPQIPAGDLLGLIATVLVFARRLSRALAQGVSRLRDRAGLVSAGWYRTHVVDCQRIEQLEYVLRRYAPWVFLAILAGMAFLFYIG